MLVKVQKLDPLFRLPALGNQRTKELVAGQNGTANSPAIKKFGISDFSEVIVAKTEKTEHGLLKNTHMIETRQGIKNGSNGFLGERLFAYVNNEERKLEIQYIAPQCTGVILASISLETGDVEKIERNLPIRGVNLPLTDKDMSEYVPSIKELLALLNWQLAHESVN